MVRQQNGDQLAIAMVQWRGLALSIVESRGAVLGGNGSSRSWYENRRVLKREGVLFIG